MKLTIMKPVEVEFKHFRMTIEPRYWEDATLNDEIDEEGNMPFRSGNSLCLTIDLDTGEVLEWPKGTAAELNYKVCDAGFYELLAVTSKDDVHRDGYVPSNIIGEWGDYIRMTINEDGFVEGWDGQRLSNDMVRYDE